jgi:hypothetical protein
MEHKINAHLTDDLSCAYTVDFYSDDESNVEITAYKLPTHTRYVSQTFKDKGHITLLDKVFNAVAKGTNNVTISSFGAKEIKLIVDGKFYSLTKDVAQTEVERVEKKMEYELKNANDRIEILTKIALSLTDQVERLETIVTNQNKQIQELQNKNS